MITFAVAVACLLVGYFIGCYVGSKSEKFARVDEENRKAMYGSLHESLRESEKKEMPRPLLIGMPYIKPKRGKR